MAECDAVPRRRIAIKGVADQLLDDGGFRRSRIAMSMEPMVRTERGAYLVDREHTPYRKAPQGSAIDGCRFMTCIQPSHASQTISRRPAQRR